MGLEERVYSVLVVSAAERFNAALSEMLPQSLFSPVRFVRGVSIAKQAIAERDFDLCRMTPAWSLRQNCARQRAR